MASKTNPSTPKLSDAARILNIPDGIATTGFGRVRRVADRLGIRFDRWQEGIGTLMLAKRSDGTYASSVGGIGMSICRQTGKTFTVGTIIVILCLTTPNLKVIWTAHRTRTSAETFKSMQALVKRPGLSRHCKAIRQTNGQEEIAFANGSRILFGAREQGFGRGFAAVDVIIFDEAQTLPGDYLAPCVSAIAQLIQHYHSTAVLCTATQPALEPLFRRFAPELHPQEITPDAARLYEVLRRTTLQDLGTLPQEEFAARLADHPQVLCVVNRRKTAQQLYKSLPAEGSYCLTTLLCAADRRRQLDDIRQRLKEGLPCRVVSTSLIEAGVDVDFPVAYREQCGLDSLLQTAGRCNREGRRGAEESIVYRFRLDECSTPQMLRQNVSALDYTARHQDTLDTPRAIQLYFNELSDLRGPDAVDKHGILDAFLRGIRGCQFPFAQVAEEFRLIENAARTVYLPVGEGAALCEQLRSGHVTRTLLRKLGVYSVSCYPQQFERLRAAGVLAPLPDGSAILTDTSCYSEKTGLAMDVETGIGLYF